MSTPKLIDIHTHVQFAAFGDDADFVVQRALDAGIWMINVGTQKDTSKKAVDLAYKYQGVWATVGLHPIHTEKSYHDEKELGGTDGFTSRGEDFEYDYYKKLASDPKVVAIGECGLDYYRVTKHETRNMKQKKAFEMQIALANEIKKPLMIHCREAFADLISILEKTPPVFSGGRFPGVIHFFSGTIEDAKKLMDLGFSFSFGGVITFAREYEQLIKFIPLDRIVLETDAPYVAPQVYRGKRNEPLYVEEVAKKIARILNKDFEEIARVTTENAIKVFNLR